jgi:predicted 2-oxoglutarate/Fe(II)-dependent dioxygenase YbiX
MQGEDMADSKAPGLVPGDLFPELVLPEPSGGMFNFTDQNVAGNTLILFLARNGLQPEMAARLEALAAPFDDCDALLFCVTSRTGDDNDDCPVPVVFDPEWRLAGVLGLGDDGILIGHPRGRVHSIEAGHDVDAALTMAQAIQLTREPRIVGSGAPVLIVPDVLEPDLCRALIDYWEAQDKQHDLVASGKDAQDATNQIKRRSDVMIRDKPLFERLKNRILQRLIPEIRRAYCFQVASFEALRIGCYDSSRGGFFKRHRDNATKYTAHRSFAMSLNLNTGEYEGGQVRFPEFGGELYQSPPGGAVVFSCNLLHEAMPVTSGRRFAVFTFFADAAGQAREQKMIEEQRKMGRKGVAVS